MLRRTRSSKRQKLGSLKEPVGNQKRLLACVEQFHNGRLQEASRLYVSHEETAAGFEGFWSNSSSRDGPDCWTHNFPHGGQVCFYPKFAPTGQCGEIYRFVKKQYRKVLRQYPIQSGQEPRLHGLLDCSETADKPLTYTYHNVQMRSLEKVSILESLKEVSHQAARVTLKQGETCFNMGCNVVLYRNARDGIGWHADNTQQEEKIFTVVVHADPVRKLVIAPQGNNGKRKTNSELQEGDQQVTLYPAEGDAYSMDKTLQKYYLHSVPKVPQGRKITKSSKHRLILVFRHGLEKRAVDDKPDQGKIPSSLDGSKFLSAEERHPFGPMRHVIQEGQMYTRQHILGTRAFSSIQGGVSGNKKHGCSAIVVSRQDPKLNEHDHFEQLWYTATTKQGAWAMYTTYQDTKNPVRVFRSTSCKTWFGTTCIPEENWGNKKQPQMYRYDGLYEIKHCGFQSDPDVKTVLQVGTHYTFELHRMTKVGSNALSSRALLKQCGSMKTFDFTCKKCSCQFSIMN